MIFSAPFIDHVVPVCSYVFLLVDETLRMSAIVMLIHHITHARGQEVSSHDVVAEHV